MTRCWRCCPRHADNTSTVAANRRSAAPEQVNFAELLSRVRRQTHSFRHRETPWNALAARWFGDKHTDLWIYTPCQLEAGLEALLKLSWGI